MSSKHRWFAAAFLGASLLLAQPASAQELPEWLQRLKVSGLAFGDIYAVAQHHDADIDGANGAWMRRIYLTFDEKLDDEFSFRLRFEAASPGDFESAATMT
ncbi:MAG: hypothetical protein D6701_14695, partial [Gemmatimonadetes bacterium]